MKTIAVSACLLGQNVRYNGTNKLNTELINVINGNNIIPICPESVFINPHLPIEIKDNQAFMSNGDIVTKKLTASCMDIYKKIKDVDFVVLKTKSPTCGYKLIYDGSFTNTLIEGNGFLTRILLENKIKVYSELDIDLIKKELI